jgi:hypothetical protein
MPKGRPCKVCQSDKRNLVEVGLVLGTSLRTLSQRFGLSVDSIFNHKHNHLTPQQRAAILAAVKPSEVDLEELERLESQGLLGALIGQRARLQQIVEMAMELSDLGRCISAERAITENLSLVAKLLGQLVTHHEVRHTSLLISPDYIRLRQAIVQALMAFPDAARAVSAALHRLESEAAKDITENAKRGKPLLIDSRPLEAEMA